MDGDEHEYKRKSYRTLLFRHLHRPKASLFIRCSLAVTLIALALLAINQSISYSSRTQNFRFKYVHKVCIITRVKNSAYFLPQWIEYHVLLGIDKIYIVNDCSDDDDRVCNYIFYTNLRSIFELLHFLNRRNTGLNSMNLKEWFNITIRIRLAIALITNHKKESSSTTYFKSPNHLVNG